MFQLRKLIIVVCVLGLVQLSYSQEKSENSSINDEQCEKNKIDKISEQRKVNFKKLEIGSKLPDIKLSFEDNENLYLSKLGFEYVLLVFWRSECSVCEMLLPQFAQMYNTYNRLGFEVVGISMDDNIELWQKSIQENDYPWKNHCDGLGWNGPIAEAYNVYGTPTILLLNNNLEIAAFPKSIQAFDDFLKLNLDNKESEFEM